MARKKSEKNQNIEVEDTSIKIIKKRGHKPKNEIEDSSLPTVKKRGRKPKSELEKSSKKKTKKQENKDKVEVEDSSIKVPKKRGRKPKVDKSKFENFPEYIETYVKTKILENYNFINEMFSSEEPITKENWLKCRDMISEISEELIKYNKLCVFNSTITKKSNSTLKGIDEYREKYAKSIILHYLNSDLREPNKSYMVYLHIKKYLQESCKELKI